jgi:hypothetical protein
MRLILSAVLILSLGQGAGLKIVVVAGEDSVNIIQQKTAVAPVVEVRDRNDLPVAGVAVLFTINGGGASFAGGQALTVTTDAAGRATAASLTPTGNGAIQIDVTATSQGQTATATVHQNNFATVRQAQQAGRTPSPASNTAAAAAAGATAGVVGGAGGGGGGLSGAAIAAITAAAAGGAIVAGKALSGGSSSTPSTPSGPTTVNVSGPFSGNLPLTGSAANGIVCTFNSALAGTVRMALTVQGSTVTGQLTGNGTSTSTQVSCPGFSSPGGGTDTFVLSGPVTGSPSALRYSQTVDAGGQGFTGSLVLTFTGTLSAGVVTGTLAVTFNQQAPGIVVAGVTSMPVTLR